MGAGAVLPAWFDIIGVTPQDPEDADGIKEASETIIQKYIESEITQGIPASRIMVGGFSQGGALATYLALTYKESLAGVILLSGWLPLHRQFLWKCRSGAAGRRRKVPILQCHGDCDYMVKYEFAKMTHHCLVMCSSDARLLTYKKLPHSTCSVELGDVATFVYERLPVDWPPATWTKYMKSNRRGSTCVPCTFVSEMAEKKVIFPANHPLSSKPSTSISLKSSSALLVSASPLGKTDPPKWILRPARKNRPASMASSSPQAVRKKQSIVDTKENNPRRND
jgi:lysophospholipase-2